MKLSLFKIGLVLVIIGIVWTSLIFVDTEKTFEEVLLKQSTSFELESEFVGSDIGFYKVYMPEFSGEEVLALNLLLNLYCVQNNLSNCCH